MEKRYLREWLNRFRICDFNHAYRLVFEYMDTFYNTVKVLALQEGILNHGQIVKWVHDFQIAGPDALRPHKKEWKTALDKPKKIQKHNLIKKFALIQVLNM